MNRVMSHQHIPQRLAQRSKTFHSKYPLVAPKPISLNTKSKIISVRSISHKTEQNSQLSGSEQLKKHAQIKKIIQISTMDRKFSPISNNPTRIHEPAKNIQNNDIKSNLQISQNNNQIPTKNPQNLKQELQNQKLNRVSIHGRGMEISLQNEIFDNTYGTMNSMNQSAKGDVGYGTLLSQDPRQKNHPIQHNKAAHVEAIHGGSKKLTGILKKTFQSETTPQTGEAKRRKVNIENGLPLKPQNGTKSKFGRYTSVKIPKQRNEAENIDVKPVRSSQSGNQNQNQNQTEVHVINLQSLNNKGDIQNLRIPANRKVQITQSEVVRDGSGPRIQEIKTHKVVLYISTQSYEKL